MRKGLTSYLGAGKKYATAASTCVETVVQEADDDLREGDLVVRFESKGASLNAAVFRDPFLRAPLYFMEISRNCTRILSDARAVASASVTAPAFYSQYGNFAKIQWRPTLRYPTARASKAHRPTKLNLQNLLN